MPMKFFLYSAYTMKIAQDFLDIQYTVVID